MTDAPQAKPRLLVVTSTYPRFPGDHEPGFVAELCVALADRFDILVVTQSRPGCVANEIIDGIRIHRFRYAPGRFELLSEHGGITNTLRLKPVLWLFVPAFVLAQWIALIRAILHFRPRLIHAHWLLPQGLLCSAAKWVTRASAGLVVTSHGHDLLRLGGVMLNRVKRLAIHHCDHYCVVSEAMADWAVNHLSITRDRLSVCPMGVDLDSIFTPSEAIASARRRLVFHGRLIKRKGVHHLIAALAELTAAGHDYHLVIVGYGPEEQPLKQLTENLQLQPRVIFAGSKTRQELPDILHRAEIAVYPFVATEDGEAEGLGLVVAEAMGCGCPVIVGDIPAVRDLVQHETTGIIVDATSPGALAQAIIKLSDDAATQTRLVQNAKDQLRQTYSWPACANRYRRIFETLLKAGETA